MSTSTSEFAFYYPNPIWWDGDWIKNLILFFDGIALLVPDYMRGRLSRGERGVASIVAGLNQHGLLRIFSPEQDIDPKAAETLATAMTDIIASGALDQLAGQPSEFQEISYSRLGSEADRDLARLIHEALIERGLARESEDGYSIPMHPTVRALVLTLWPQILRPLGKKEGLDLQPVTEQPRLLSALRELLTQRPLPSAGHVVSLDIQTVGVDLGAVPFDEILAFKAQNGSEFRRYARNLRAFLRDLATMSPEERDVALVDRKVELEDEAADLRQSAQQAWKGAGVGYALGIAGAAWTTVHGPDPVGALIALGGTLYGVASSKQADVSAYSYLFRARSHFS